MADLTDNVNWDSKGAFSTPTADLTESISWNAKGSVGTPATDLTEVVEWNAEGSFVPVYSQTIVEIDLN